MSTSKTTPKDFFLWIGATIALYFAVYSFIALIFNYLNYVMPDALQYYASDPYVGGMSYEMALLLVSYPIFGILSLLIVRSIRADSSRAEVWVRRWTIYFTLFLAGAIIAGDLVTLIMYFFNGEIALRFLLKVLVLLLVAVGIFLHYLADLRNYWTKERTKSRIVQWATSLLVGITLVAGFFIVGTPWQARLYRFDDQKVNDLQTIQSQVVSYYQAKQTLPTSLADLNNSISGFSIPTDPQTAAAYEYTAKGKLSFELCATFNAPTQPYSQSGRSMPVAEPVYGRKNLPDTWDHTAGRTCYERTIDPHLYPPFNKGL